MNRPSPWLGWLDDKSDWLSPLVVKEVRQVVRGREFNLSFGASLVAGLAIAFAGAGMALTGDGTSGVWTFAALMGCLALLGLAIVPLGAFNALRHERAEQTLDLITVTALSPRRVVIGKLLAQAVKLATLFAAIAPFIAMSFLLGGIDFVTILVALVVLFMWSLWISAACLLLSTLFASRAMSGLVFAALGLLALLLLGTGRSFMFALSRGAPLFGSSGPGAAGPLDPWGLAIMTTVWLTTLVNLVLLAENRLLLPGEERATAVRVGFLLQFLLLLAWTLGFLNHARWHFTAYGMLAVLGAGHLALVAAFAVTEDLAVPRLVRRQWNASSARRRLLALFRSGAGRGALYVLVQMGILLAACRLFQPGWMEMGRLLASFGYICFFTGVPAVALRWWRPARATALKARIGVLVVLAMSLVLPDVIHYMVMRPEVLSLDYSARHLLNPFRTLANWRLVEANQWFFAPIAIGVTGLLAYAVLIVQGRRLIAQARVIEPIGPVAAADTGRADVLD